MKLSPYQLKALRMAVGRDWFEPVGWEWRTCDSLVKLGLMEHNGADRGKGERFRVTQAGNDALNANEGSKT